MSKADYTLKPTSDSRSSAWQLFKSRHYQKLADMKMIMKRFLLSCCVCLLSTGICIAQIAHKSQWMYPDAKGKLTYKTLEGGDKIMDFSYAGYMGGGVSIPLVPVTITLTPS